MKNKKKSVNLFVIKIYKGKISAAEVLFRILKLAVERMEEESIKQEK
ncbi:MAG TPA: hypothetical protein GXX20_01870 [Clostridiaceae bacterium]|nr:hypothetical protein [Clostridiaceae bacterium]